MRGEGVESPVWVETYDGRGGYGWEGLLGLWSRWHRGGELSSGEGPAGTGLGSWVVGTGTGRDSGVEK